MVAAVGLLNSQSKVFSAPSGATPTLKVTTGAVFAAAAYPSDFVRTSQARIHYLASETNKVNVAQAKLLAAGVGRIFDPKVRVFTFTLDGHDYVAIRLGNYETLIYDTHADQFYIWGSGDSRLWQAYDGINWPGGGKPSYTYGSNIVVGDDGNGSIYFLDPDADEDDDSIQGTLLKRPFRREVSGQYPVTTYSALRCYGIELYGSIGQYDAGILHPEVTLSYSDDRGDTYVSPDPITVERGDWEGRLFWRSLGSVGPMGRIFTIKDYGALKRIDTMLMISEGEGKV